MEKSSMTTEFTRLKEVSPLFTSLGEKLIGDIDCSYEALSKNSKDGSSCRIWPRAIIYPKNNSDIKEVLSFSLEYKIPVAVRGKGSCESGGSLTEGIHLDLTRYFDQIKNIDVLNNSTVVETGVIISDLKNKLNSWGLEIPLFTEENKHKSIGGIIANKEVNDMSLLHGSIREWVDGITVILDNGEEHKIEEGITPSGRLLEIYEKIFPLLSKNDEVIRIAKPQTIFNTSGYDIWSHSIGPKKLMDLIIGSQGTLGIVTSVKLRTSPKTKIHSSIACNLKSYKEVTEVIDIFNHNNAESIFCFDETVFKLTQKYKNYLTEKLITQEDSFITLVGTIKANSQNDIRHKENLLLNSLPIKIEDKKILDEYETENYKLIANSAKELLEKYGNKKLIPILLTDDIIIPTKSLSTFLEETNNLISKRGIIYTITGNIGYGHISIIPLININSNSSDDSLFFLTKDLFSLVKKYHGSISGTKNDGIARTPFLNLIYNMQIVEIFKEIKTIFDPNFVFNPGKKTTIDLNYLKQSLLR